jgi:hypothetical protein
MEVQTMQAQPSLTPINSNLPPTNIRIHDFQFLFLIQKKHERISKAE